MFNLFRILLQRLENSETILSNFPPILQFIQLERHAKNREFHGPILTIWSFTVLVSGVVNPLSPKDKVFASAFLVINTPSWIWVATREEEDFSLFSQNEGETINKSICVKYKLISLPYPKYRCAMCACAAYMLTLEFCPTSTDAWLIILRIFETYCLSLELERLICLDISKTYIKKKQD